MRIILRRKKVKKVKIKLDKKTKIFFAIITIFCIFSVAFAVYIQFFSSESASIATNPESINNEEIYTTLKDEFSNIFTNEYHSNSYNSEKITKIDDTKELIYTSTENKQKVSGKYDLNVSIPVINIADANIDKANKEINETFKSTADAIVQGTPDYIIFDVQYVAYINNNILSLVIESNLKQGDNPQRVIVKTYNYNLDTLKSVTLEEMIAIKNLDKEYVNNKIREEIKNESKKASDLKELGYTVYNRDLKSEMYDLENTNNYFLGKDNYLYILYPYGNTNKTSETDIIIF